VSLISEDNLAGNMTEEDLASIGSTVAETTPAQSASQLQQQRRIPGVLDDRSPYTSALDLDSSLDSLTFKRRLVRLLLCNNFYRSVFSGHHVAINCMGSRMASSAKGVSIVDYGYSIAFAKVVRMFNCMELDDAIYYRGSAITKESQFWKEIHGMCYGNDPSAPPNRFETQHGDRCNSKSC
jgi:hypothetical protein